MSQVARCTFLLTLSAALSWGAVARLTSVQPRLVKPGDAVVAKGESVGPNDVVKLFLTTGSKDIEIEMKDRTADSIGFSIPADIELGSYRLMIQTGGPTPALMEQPVMVEVMTAEELAERRKEEERLSKAPEPAPR